MVLIYLFDLFGGAVQVSLEQWQALIAVVDQGGYAQAAESLSKSQSSVSYAVQKIESELSIRIFRLEGRKAKLTELGESIVQHARRLIEQAQLTEQVAKQLGEGGLSRLRVSMDSIFPETLMLEALALFSERYPYTRVELRETTLSGTDEALLGRQADLVIGGRVPPGFLGEPLLRVPFLAVAHPDHPLHHRPAPLTLEDLKLHRQLVVMDSGRRRLDSGWLGAEQRWSFNVADSSIKAACMGLGFAWYPETRIQEALSLGLLKPLPMERGSKRYVELYLIYADGNFCSEPLKEFGEILRQRVSNKELS